MHVTLSPVVFAVAALGCSIDSAETAGTPQMHVNATNALGESVGYLETRAGFPRAVWRSRGGALVDLGTLPGGLRSSAVALDDAGTIVGQSETASGEFRAALWRDGVLRDLGTLPGGHFSVASAIDRGVVLGESESGDGELHVFRWQDGRMTDAGRFNVPASGAPPPPRDRR